MSDAQSRRSHRASDIYSNNAAPGIPRETYERTTAQRGAWRIIANLNTPYLPYVPADPGRAARLLAAIAQINRDRMGGELLK